MPRHNSNNTKCNQKITDIICEALKVGQPIEAAVAVAGISQQTYYNWMNWGREGRSPYCDFVEAVDQAQGVAMGYLYEQLRGHFHTNWQTIAWVLERKWPGIWGRVDRLAIQANMKHNIDVRHGIEDHAQIPVLIHDDDSRADAKQLLRRLAHAEDRGPTDSAGPDELRDLPALPSS